MLPYSPPSPLLPLFCRQASRSTLEGERTRKEGRRRVVCSDRPTTDGRIVDHARHLKHVALPLPPPQASLSYRLHYYSSSSSSSLPRELSPPPLPSLPSKQDLRPSEKPTPLPLPPPPPPTPASGAGGRDSGRKRLTVQEKNRENYCTVEKGREQRTRSNPQVRGMRLRLLRKGVSHGPYSKGRERERERAYYYIHYCFALLLGLRGVTTTTEAEAEAQRGARQKKGEGANYS